MQLGIAIQETWSFFHEIYADLQAHHSTSLFKARQVKLPLLSQRINQLLYQQTWSDFLKNNQVVFFEWASEFLSYASQLPKTSGLVTRLHRYEMYHWADKINWSAVDKIILVSQAKKREFSSRFPEQAEKIVVIPEAISPQRFKPVSKKFEGDIGILCHLIPRKRVYELILAFADLDRQRAGFHLHIGGPEYPLHRDYYEAMQALVVRLGLDDKVTFYGNVDNPDEWYAKIDIFISNGYSEGLQVAPLEAMASQRLVLSHWWEGADEMLPVENLYLTNGELVERILQFSDASESKRRSYREFMRHIVCEKFNIDNTKIQIRNVIEQVGAARTSKTAPR